jgi:hypothetical protein
MNVLGQSEQMKLQNGFNYLTKNIKNQKRIDMK